MKRLLAVVGAVTALTVSGAGIALADGNGDRVSDANRLRCHVVDDTKSPPVVVSSCNFQDVGNNGDDSPLDSNDRALVSTVTTGHHVEAYTQRSLNLNKPASRIKNLSFDIRTSDIQGGSPRIVLAFANPLSDGSSYLFLDAANCNQPISSTWSRADFTGRTASGCTIYTSGGTPYSSDGTNSAYQNFVSANPNAVVAYDFFVEDVPGTYYVDRVSLGTGHLYNYSNSRAMSCSSEASC